MSIMQIPDGIATELAHIPEVGMGMQAAQISDTAVLVVGGEIAILPDKGQSSSLRSLPSVDGCAIRRTTKRRFPTSTRGVVRYLSRTI